MPGSPLSTFLLKHACSGCIWPCLDVAIMSGFFSVFVTDLLRQQMKEAGFQQLVSALSDHTNATVNSVAATISLSNDGDIG